MEKINYEKRYRIDRDWLVVIEFGCGLPSIYRSIGFADNGNQRFKQIAFQDAPKHIRRKALELDD